jgi:hypothetical protein
LNFEGGTLKSNVNRTATPGHVAALKQAGRVFRDSECAEAPQVALLANFRHVGNFGPG